MNIVSAKFTNAEHTRGEATCEKGMTWGFFVGSNFTAHIEKAIKDSNVEIAAYVEPVPAPAASYVPDMIALRALRDAELDRVDTRECCADKWDQMTAEQKTAWRDYKQALRDLPEGFDFAGITTLDELYANFPAKPNA